MTHVLYFFLGLICGMIIAVLNVILIKDETIKTPPKIEGIKNKPATIVDMSNPIKDL